MARLIRTEVAVEFRFVFESPERDAPADKSTLRTWAEQFIDGVRSQALTNGQRAVTAEVVTPEGALPRGLQAIQAFGEHQALDAAMTRAQGQRGHAAALLGIAPHTLRCMLRRNGLEERWPSRLPLHLERLRTPAPDPVLVS